MFGKKLEKATADWPKTRLLRNGAIHVTGRYVQPALVKPTQYIYGWGAFAGIFYILAQTSEPVTLLIAAALLGAGYPFVWRPFMFNIFGKSVDVKIFPEMIQIKGKKFSRGVPIEFRVEQHHKAIPEARKEEKLQEKQSTTYREAIEVVMQYGEKRIVLAEMLEKELEKAKALVIRVQDTCDRFDEAIVRMAEGQISPAGESQPVGGDFGPSPDIR